MKLDEVVQKEFDGNVNVAGRRLKIIPVGLYPPVIRGNFDLSDNELVDLENGPAHVTLNYYAKHNKLKSLNGCPIVVNGRFDVSDNDITTIDHLPEFVHVLSLARNKIKSISGIHKMIKDCTAIDFSGNSIREAGIGLILIKGLEKVAYDHNDENWNPNFTSALNIIRKYLGQGSKSLLKCQQELIDIGLEAFAKI